MGIPDFKKRVMTLLRGEATGYHGLPDLDAALIDDIFADAYDPTERAAIQAWFEGRTIEVLGEYARTPSSLPAVFVYRLSDVEDPQRSNLGDFMGYRDIGAETLDHEYGVRMNEEVEIAMWAHSSPTMRDALYGAVKMLVLRGRSYLESGGVDMVIWRGGRDGQGFLEGQAKAPHIIHTASARLQASTRTTWRLELTRPDELNGKSEYNEWIDEG